MDIEGRSLTKSDGIDRRNKAHEARAGLGGRERATVQVAVHAADLGLRARGRGLAVLQNAVANGTRVDVVNTMVFDYYDRVTTDMGGAAVSAANGLLAQLHTLLSGEDAALSSTRCRHHDHAGLDDYPQATENTTVADAQQL